MGYCFRISFGFLPLGAEHALGEDSGHSIIDPSPFQLKGGLPAESLLNVLIIVSR